MGLGIVLLFWGIVGVILASGAAWSLVVVVRSLAARTGRVVSRGWVVTAAALPFVTLAYVGAAFVAYGAYCEVVRDVDIGIGDSWRVPLGDGYRLVMIDIPQQAFIEAPNNRELHSAVKRVGVLGDFIAGEDEHGFFVITSHQRTEKLVSSETDLRAALPSGIADRLQLLTPWDFYQQQRWGWPDVVAALLMLVPPLAAFGFLALRFVHSLST